VSGALARSVFGGKKEKETGLTKVTWGVTHTALRPMKTKGGRTMRFAFKVKMKGRSGLGKKNGIAY